MFKKFLKNEKGLTLIELLAVIVILGIVAAIAVPSVTSIIQKSKVDAVKADAIQVLNAAKTYVASNGVPEDGSLGKDDLKDYVSDNAISEGDASFTVTVTDDGKTFTLTANNIEAGSAKVSFTNATIKMIDESEDYEDPITIGSASQSNNNDGTGTNNNGE
jgi:type IV pilus assembly protein PilA